MIRTRRGFIAAGVACMLWLTVVSLISSANAEGQTGKSKTIKKSAVKSQAAPMSKDSLAVEDTKAFFNDFVMRARPLPRDPFESDAEYAAKAPPPWDSSKTVYLEVEPEFIEKFTYKAETETLTLFAGATAGFKQLEKIAGVSMREWGNSFVPLFVKSVLVKEGEYEGSNAAGVKKTVKKWRQDGYIILIQNKTAIPEDLIKNNVIGYDLKPYFTIERELARTLTKEEENSDLMQLQVIAGFKLQGYGDSGTSFDHTTPTIDRPSEDTYYLKWIKGDVVRLLVRDRRSKKVYADFNFIKKPSDSE